MIENRINFVDLSQVNKKYKKSYFRLIKKIYDSSSFIKSRYNLILEKQICKMVEKRTWSSQSPLRQFSGIPDVIIRKLEKNSDITIRKIMN